MCGRYVMSKATGDLLSHFDAKEVEGEPAAAELERGAHPECAGLYEWWADPSLPDDDPERWLLSCTVLTTTGTPWDTSTTPV